MADDDRDPTPAEPARRRRPAEPVREAAPAPERAGGAGRSRKPQEAGRDGTDPTSPAATPSPASAVPRDRPSRPFNRVSPLPERARGSRSAPNRSVPDREAPEIGEAGGPTHRPGDVPPSLTRRYFTEVLRGGAAIAFYEGPGSKTVAFHDHGSRLATDQSHPAMVRDLAAIAAHRGWRSLEVKGEDEFRRGVWLEARALGLQVKGYKPRERDQQELDSRLEAVAGQARRGERSPEATPAPAGRSDGPTKSPLESRARPDFEAGVAGTLLASGVAPYRRRTGEPVTPYIRIDRGDGRALDVWGVGLPDALRRSGAQVGDAVQVRRDGVDVLQRSVEVRDPRIGVSSPQLRDVNRNRWVIEAERFRQASPAEAARDARLRGAQSHLAVLNTVIDRSVKDAEGRERLRAEAREIVAGELAQGRRFTPARVRDVEPVLGRDLAQAQAQAREVAPERAHRR